MKLYFIFPEMPLQAIYFLKYCGTWMVVLSGKSCITKDTGAVRSITQMYFEIIKEKKVLILRQVIATKETIKVRKCLFLIFWSTDNYCVVKL